MELRDIQASLRATIADRSALVGPFLVLINAGSDNPFRNYAVPVDGAEPTEADVATLIRYFATRDRLPDSSTSGRRRPWTRHSKRRCSTSTAH